jgi:hypothetical protein
MQGQHRVRERNCLPFMKVWFALLEQTFSLLPRRAKSSPNDYAKFGMH